MKMTLFFTNCIMFTAAAGFSLPGNSAQGDNSADGQPEVLPGETRGSKPNIIFILADDMGNNDLSINGQTNFQTPALDRMAREG
jgi:hypothetical protein